MNVVYAQFSDTGYTAPVRVRNLRRIARVRTACQGIIQGSHGFAQNGKLEVCNYSISDKNGLRNLIEPYNDAKIVKT